MTTNPKELLESEIINYLINDKNYFENTFSYLKDDYFSPEYQVFYKAIKEYYSEYKSNPSIKELILLFKDKPKKDKELLKEKIDELKYKDAEVNEDFLIQSTEKFIKQKIFEQAIITGAESLSHKDENKFHKSFQLAEEAVKVSLNTDFGTELYDIDKRFEEYLPQNGLKLGIQSFDKVIGDGYTPGTLHLIISPSGVGKSAMLSTFAVQFLLQKRDVVLLSLEMSEAQFYKRIDANICDINIHDLGVIDKEVLKMKYNQNKENLGNLIIKEFPAGSLTPLKIDAYLNKLKNEKGIDTPVLMVDYLTLMKSDLVKQGENSYGYFKSVAEELRSIAQKRGIIIFTPMQSNRSSVNNLEADQSTLSDSMAVYMTADSAFMILQTPEMKQQGKMKINFVKNRMSGRTVSFDINYDYNKFRILDDYISGGENITEVEHQSIEGELLKDDLMGLLS